MFHAKHLLYKGDADRLKGCVRVFGVAASLFLCASLTSCASPSTISSHVHTLINSGDYDRAKRFLDQGRRHYGAQNTLLYFLDQGMLLHLAGEYQESNQFLERAKRICEDLYTQSLTEILASWVVNGYARSYAGEDYERVLIHVFAALNYVLLDDMPAAIVEARAVDETLRLLSSRYGPDEQNRYREEAFARFLSGILYQLSQDSEGYNNAFIAYRKAADAYTRIQDDPRSLPQVLHENLFAAAELMGIGELHEMQSRYGMRSFMSLTDQASKAQVYFLHYNGPSPSKTELVVPIMLSDGNVLIFALPQIHKQAFQITASTFIAQSASGETIKASSDCVCDIQRLAKMNLEDRRTRIAARTIALAAGKYALQKQGQRWIGKAYGDTAQAYAVLISNVFSIATHRADLRSWQTLPGEIRLARLLLDPGEYQFTARYYDVQSHERTQVDLGRIVLGKGERRFFVVKTAP